MHMDTCLSEWSNSMITFTLLPANAVATSFELSATAVSIFLLTSASWRLSQIRRQVICRHLSPWLIVHHVKERSQACMH